MARRFEGKTALITGGSRGIGKACAIAFAREGTDVAFTYLRNTEEAERTRSSLGQFRVKSQAFQLDTSKANDVNQALRNVLNEFGRIDILVNNAGVLKRTPFLGMEESEWDRILDVNLKGYFLVGQAVAREMVSRKIKGTIINISSNAQERPGPNLAHYDVSKAGVAMLTQCMALELSQYGIRVNSVAPGLIETDMNKKDLMDPEYRERRLSRIPLKLIGTAEDVSGTVLFLASDEARLATGHTIFLEAGANL
jgi:NAD(P)-dependent dehydrogenase (short-subunit alcohol dehydrogenase family)